MTELTLTDGSKRSDFTQVEDTCTVLLGLEDFNCEFSFEDFERVTGRSYQSYLRFYDDMT